MDISSLSLADFWARLMERFISLESFSFSWNISRAKMSFQLILYSGAYLSMDSSIYWIPGVVNFWGNLITFLLTLEMSY